MQFQCAFIPPDDLFGVAGSAVCRSLESRRQSREFITYNILYPFRFKSVLSPEDTIGGYMRGGLSRFVCLVRVFFFLLPSARVKCLLGEVFLFFYRSVRFTPNIYYGRSAPSTVSQQFSPHLCVGCAGDPWKILVG